MTINMAKVYAGNQGYTATVAHNDNCDYLEIAYAQALSIKTTQKKITNYAVIVDEKINKRITDQHRKVFDEIVVIDGEWDFSREWEVRNLSPWRRTVKVDADMLFTESIDHWWDSLESHRILFTTTVETYKGTQIKHRHHRRVFDQNSLPDIYTAFYYFRDCPESAEFFELVKEISDDWAWFACEFLTLDNQKPQDDEIFSVAAKIYGISKCTLPGAQVPRFVHMREVLNELPTELPWHQQIYSELNNNLWVGHYPQSLPFHYCSKSFINKEIINEYKQNYRKLFKSTREL